MAKPSVDTFEKMINFIQSQLRSKRFVENYQPVMIKLLILNGDQSKQQIAEELWKQNNFKKNTSFYLTVPVYRVLVDNGVVIKREDIFSLALQNISEPEKQTLLEEINSSISRQTNFSKTGFLPIKEAREKARELAKQHNLKNNSDWNEFVKSGQKPDNIPSNPSRFYNKKKNQG